jgi:hypothetical protein
MSRKLKTMGLALIAVFALTAVGDGAASAAEFHSTAATTKISASQTTTHNFTTTIVGITCEKATFSGTQTTATTTSVEFAPTYSGCHFIIFGSTIAITVATNECKYRLNASGTADIVCPVGKAITVSGAGCTITVGAQTGKKSVTYANKEAKHIDITTNLTGINYSHSGFTCGTGSGTNGTYTGTTTASGTDTSGKAVVISYS